MKIFKNWSFLCLSVLSLSLFVACSNQAVSEETIPDLSAYSSLEDTVQVSGSTETLRNSLSMANSEVEEKSSQSNVTNDTSQESTTDEDLKSTSTASEKASASDSSAQTSSNASSDKTSTTQTSSTSTTATSSTQASSKSSTPNQTTSAASTTSVSTSSTAETSTNTTKNTSTSASTATSASLTASTTKATSAPQTTNTTQARSSTKATSTTTVKTTSTTRKSTSTSTKATTPVTTKERVSEKTSTASTSTTNALANHENVAERVLAQTNAYRKQAGVEDLRLDKELSRLAGIRAQELIEEYSHDRPDGRVWHTVLSDNKFRVKITGENIAMGTYRAFSPEQMTEGWYNSQGHKENLLRENFSRIGIAYAEDRASGFSFYVQIFAD